MVVSPDVAGVYTGSHCTLPDGVVFDGHVVEDAVLRRYRWSRSAAARGGLPRGRSARADPDTETRCAASTATRCSPADDRANGGHSQPPAAAAVQSAVRPCRSARPCPPPGHDRRCQVTPPSGHTPVMRRRAAALQSDLPVRAAGARGVGRRRTKPVSPELWVTLAVGLGTPISAVIVAVINRRRGGGGTPTPGS